MTVAVRAAATVAPLVVAALAAGEGEGSSAPARRQLRTQVAAGRPATHAAPPSPRLHCYARRRGREGEGAQGVGDGDERRSRFWGASVGAKDKDS